LNDLQRRIFHDRYAAKTPVAEGVTVFNRQKTGPHAQSLGRVTATRDMIAQVEWQDGTLSTEDARNLLGLLETEPEQMWQRIARAVAAVETPAGREEWEPKFRAILRDFKYVPAGRILAGAGIDANLTYINCFVIPSPRDSRGGIVDALKVQAEIMARGGGVGFDISTLRPQGAPVLGVNGTSSGPVDFANLYSTMTGIIEQAGSRRGALMQTIHDWHPDLLRFISAKSENEHFISHANLSVLVSDRLMLAVREDLEWAFVFPNTSAPDYNERWNGDIDAWIAGGGSVVEYGRMPARKVWRAIAEYAHRRGEPGVIFIDTVYRESTTNANFKGVRKEVSCNPCVTGDTLIYTDQGLIPARELAARGLPVKVLVDERFNVGAIQSASNVFSTGVKPVYRVRTREGYTVRVTENHLIKTDRGWVEAVNLVLGGDRIHIVNRGGAFGDEGSYDLGLVLGWIVGDGYLTGRQAVLSFYNDKRVIAPDIASAVNRIVRAPVNNRKYTISVTVATPEESRIQSERLFEIASKYGLADRKLQVPTVVLRGSREMQRGFLQGLFEADGTILDSPNGTRGLRLSSVDTELLTNVQRLLLNFGIYSRIYRDRSPNRHEKAMPDGKGSQKTYAVQPWHDLSISRGSIIRFAEEIGFLSPGKTAHLDQVVADYSRGPYAEDFTAQVVDVTPDGIEEVFDLTEPSSHSFVADGVVVHNCGEQNLPEYGVCNLGALNLTAFVKDGKFDFKDLAKTTEVAVRFQDDVIDASYYPLPENEEWAKKERRVGIGVMGLADMLIMLGARYGSEEARRITESVFRTIRDAAYSASCDLALEKRPFPAFDRDGYMQSAFVVRLPGEIQKRIYEDGIRNITLLTVAPTGTTSLLADVSSGIEPVFRFRTLRKDALGEHVILHPLAEAWQTEHPGEPLPDYFVSAEQLTPEEHVLMQAVAQAFIDASISKTVNAPNNHTVEDVEHLFTYAYESGCKGITYFRDGALENVVLAEAKLDEKPTSAPVKEEKPFVELRPRPSKMMGRAYTVKTPFGMMTLDIHETEPGVPLEVFANVGAAGSDLMADAIAIGRLASTMLRMDSRIAPARRLDIIIEKLKDIGGTRSNGMFGPQKITSLATAVARGLQLYLNDIREAEDPTDGEFAVEPPAEERHGNADLCPECGSYTLVKEEGCAKCHSCGFSACE